MTTNRITSLGELVPYLNEPLNITANSEIHF